MVLGGIGVGVEGGASSTGGGGGVINRFYHRKTGFTTAKPVLKLKNRF